ncbi:MAG: anti-sigma F factor [Lachnospiraceae bacterium]|nr:anti-sigma F factor [Lachnospiraceae bacterium]
MKNEMKLVMDAISENEALARVATATFLTHLHPTLEEMEDVKTAVSEAVTNAIIHGVPEDRKVYITCKSERNILIVTVEDHGVGIENVEKAMEPLFTTKPQQERSGMGFAFMEAFMDELKVTSAPGQGTTVRMEKAIGFSRYEE